MKSRLLALIFLKFFYELTIKFKFTGKVNNDDDNQEALRESMHDQVLRLNVKVLLVSHHNDDKFSIEDDRMRYSRDTCESKKVP